MAEDDQQSLLYPMVSTLRQEHDLARQHMERTISMDIREEREDLKEAAEQSCNVILDLGLDGIVRWISPSWKDVIGTPVESVQGKPIGNVIVNNKSAFAEAVESMKQDDSRSQLIRFSVILGPLSVLKQGPQDPGFPFQQDTQRQGEKLEQLETINLEGQGIMVYDRSSGGESHTMWMIRPTPQPREVTIDLPELLVAALGVGAEMLAQYLTTLAEVGANDPANHPPPLPVLCRICERHITPWWFEKHSELCLQEHRAEMEVQLAQEALAEHRPAIVKVLDALEARKSRRTSGDALGLPLPQPEYKGLPIGPSSSPSSSSSGSPSGRTSPVTPPRTRETSSTGLGHARARSFAVRRPLSRIVELILDLCDTAMSINTAAIKELKAQPDGGFRSQSPTSESGISQILAWQTPGSSSTLEQEHGLAMLNADTEAVARAKVDTVLRHRRIIEYSERIRVEFDMHVRDCIDAAMRKAARIAAGQLSDSSTDGEEEEGDEVPEKEHFFTGSYDGSSTFGCAIRCVSDPSLVTKLERSQSSVAVTSRSDSPMECPTPRSHTQASGILGQSQSQSKRVSIFLGSDAGDSDGSLPFPAFTGTTRTESPGSERALGRSASSRERKRKSLKLPRMPSPRRQRSPVRPAQPSSPLRATKSRWISGSQEHIPSPVTSPSIPTTEFISPALSGQNHRRQSSVALSGDVLRPPTSPRLGSSSYPQARAVPPSIKDFEIIKPISKGAFGSVYLSKKKSTGDYFAIKVLKKADMVAKNQVTNVKAERAIMMWQGESDFVAKLYWTFSSKDYLYLVMEYLNGGDCASLVKVLGGLSEDWAKKYLAEVVLGVEHLHSRGIVHRDLKPDNLLIDQKGHLKLTDFGLSRMGLIGRQKRLLKSPHESTPDLLKHGPFMGASSMASSRSASFDLQGCHSPTSTPIITPDLAGQYGQPSYFTLRGEDTLGRENSRRASGYRSDSGGSDAFNAMFKNFSLNDDSSPKDSSLDEENHSDGGGSPDPYILQLNVSHSHTGQHNTPPSSMLPPPMALFDPDDQNRRFVGTPDYLAPETINGLGQDEMSDWWSLGCIMFEFLFGYPPFHAETPDQVFDNILERRIMWPEEDECQVSREAQDLMKKLMTINPKERLGANMNERFKSGGEEIRKHPWFDSINWKTLLEDEAQFIPAPENPEDTEYFDARGATLQAFAEELEDQMSSPVATPGADYPERPHDALSRVRSQVNTHSMKRSLIPLHIPAHIRDGRNRRLSEPFVNDDFGSFAFKNLPVLEKANKDVIQKLRAEAMQAQTKTSTPTLIPPNSTSPAPALDGSPLLPMPLKRTLSATKGNNRPASPSNLGQTSSSPVRASQPSSPLLVSFSAGQNHERRKASSASSTLSHPSSSSLQPGSFFDVPVPRLPNSFSFSSSASSPIKTARAPVTIQMASPDKGVTLHRTGSIPTSRTRSQTVGSQDGDLPPTRPISHYKRRSQVFDISPSSSDNEDPRAKALLRVQRRRQSSRRLSQFNLGDGPIFRPLDVLICEDHPVSRHVMEKLLEKLRCCTITVANGAEAMRYAMSEIQFDIIMMEFKLPQINGADVARMIRDTKNTNTQTPIIAVTGYLKELPQTHHFDSLIEKPPTLEKLEAALTNLCQWRPPQEGYSFQQPTQNIPHSSLRVETRRSEDSPSSQSSGPFAHMPGTSYGRSSREDSISSSFFGDASSTTTDDVPVIVSGQSAQDWAGSGLGISETSPLESKPFFHPGLPHLLHHNSAPPAVHFRSARSQRSIEAMRAKRESMEQNRHECGESGDDEDDELGCVQTRTRSPPEKRSGSKLSTEMMRTNSRGSVISTSEDIMLKQHGLMTPVPESMSESSGQYQAAPHHSTITPPEIFPKEAGEAVKVIDMDATPRPLSTQPRVLGSDQPTPRRPASPLSRQY
ncbi:serine threonine protein kinase [Lasallia pustulata]|uniref:non-specific serine/threonine protein kinase n=1 Tax=Lasallia pustulata TaxID=136370 RepID=A0A1W5DBU3_9LECA|nr:serine threonine protein kinase [Lasallia pustulata]